MSDLTISFSSQISKSNVVDDMVESNDILYAPGEKPDHTVSQTMLQVGMPACNGNKSTLHDGVCGIPSEAMPGHFDRLNFYVNT